MTNKKLIRKICLEVVRFGCYFIGGAFITWQINKKLQEESHEREGQIILDAFNQSGVDTLEE